MTPQDTMRLAQIKAIAKAAAEKFMTWELPQDFYPDNYIEFDKKYALERGIWPTGTNLMHVGQAQAMFEHCLAEALAQQDELGNASKAEQLLASHEHSLRAKFGRMKAALAQQDQDESDLLTIAHLDGYERGKRDALAQQGEQPDYDRGWKEGYKHGAWSAAPAAQPLSDEWIRERCTQTWVLEAVTEWVRLVEAAHGIGAGK